MDNMEDGNLGKRTYNILLSIASMPTIVLMAIIATSFVLEDGAPETVVGYLLMILGILIHTAGLVALYGIWMTIGMAILVAGLHLSERIAEIVLGILTVVIVVIVGIHFA